MKKKILSLTLILALVCSLFVLTACGDDKEKSDGASGDAESIIKDFAKNIQKGDVDKIVDMIDVETMNSIMDTDITEDDLEEAFSMTLDDEEISYKVSNIKKASKSDVKSALKTLKMEDNYEEFIDMFDRCEFYIADVAMEGSGEKQKVKDVFIFQKDGDDYEFVSSIMWMGVVVYAQAANAVDWGADSLSEIEVSQFNQMFTNYVGKELGSQVVDLLNKVVSNATTNSDDNDKLPDIIYLETRTSGGVTKDNISNAKTLTSAEESVVEDAGLTYSEGFTIKSDKNETNISAMSTLRSKIATKHYYQVEVNYGSNGLINYIIIKY